MFLNLFWELIIVQILTRILKQNELKLGSLFLEPVKVEGLFDSSVDFIVNDFKKALCPTLCPTG